MKRNKIRRDRLHGHLRRHVRDTRLGQIAAARQMADAASIAGRIRLVSRSGLILRGGSVGVVMLVIARICMMHFLHRGLVASAVLHLHDHRGRERAAAE